MKKVLFALVMGLLLLPSCQKENPNSNQVRQFNYAMVGNSMYQTKAVNSNDVLDAISATLPESIAIYLTSQSNGKMFQGETGKGIVLPSDEYRVIGSHNAEPSIEIVSTKTSYLSLSPTINIDENINVVNDETDYLVRGTYKSFALVIDASEVEKATVTARNGEEEISFLSSGESKIIFGQGNFSNYLKVTIYPTDKEKYKNTTFTLATTQASGTNLVEVGKWYVLHPTADGEQPKCLSLDLPDFQEGIL